VSLGDDLINPQPIRTNPNAVPLVLAGIDAGGISFVVCTRALKVTFAAVLAGTLANPGGCVYKQRGPPELHLQATEIRHCHCLSRLWVQSADIRSDAARPA
jgi:hypothetical protein